MARPERPDRRFDARSGAPVVVAGDRQDRPNLPAGACPFCPGGLEAPEPYAVRSFVNRWPPLPDGRAEILLYSPRHDASLWSLGVDGARAVVDLWAERTAALGRRDDVAYVLVFENRGAEVGATIPHPHGQLYAFDDVPPVPARELAADACAICAEDTRDRLVARAGDWWAAVPNAARYPYELLLAPDAHVPDLPGLVGESRDALAAVLVDALARLDGLFDAPMPYMLWVHQRPTDGGDWPGAHVHVEVAPLLRARDTPRFVAAGELGSGVWFNPVVPEEAAAQLRAVVPR
ncbi:MAG: galactose-1-phosphate uridylyltransferase [Actinobacteria bacterium]|nr:MAG: galactose-1-phosphate uridylyltransferase [Actinomycetota bacterium]